MPRFGSVVTAMVTPFDPDGALDLAAADAVARHLAATGSDGLVVAGTTGEGSVLTDAERIDLFRAVVEAVDIPVIAATGTNDTAHSVQMTKEAKAVGVDGVLAVTPYYNRPSPAGLSAHFRADRRGLRPAGDALRHPRPVGHDGSAPASPWSWPVRSAPSWGSRTPPATWPPRPRWWQRPRPASRSTAATTRSPSRSHRSVRSASISVAAHWAGRLFAEMIASHRAGDVQRAMQVNQQLADSYHFESSDEFPNPVPAKAACRALGLPVGQCRLPNAPAPAALDEQARAVIARSEPVVPGRTQSVA